VTRLRSDQRGFTLIEMLVAMSIGTIVMLAAFTLVDQALPASQRINDRIDANQRGRVAMENMVRELRASVCLWSGNDVNGNPTYSTPYSSADGSQVTFYSDMTTAAAAASGSFLPTQRQLAYANGAITETVTTGIGTVPQVRYTGLGTITTTRTLITNVQPIGATPIFTYYAYDATKTLQKLANPPAPADVPRIERIDIAFRALPSGGTNPNSGIDMQDSANTRVGSDFSKNALQLSNAQKGPQCAF
jgi:prepilin-type N-terminal cleavage/methylation domain-containing protein